jgi:hypothetical protein
MNGPRFILSILLGVAAAWGAMSWLSSSAHGQCAICGWRWNTYYETTYGRCGCCTCQPTYFVPRLRPCECYTACGHCGSLPACQKCRGPQQTPVADCGPWDYPPCLDSVIEPSGFERVGQIPNDMLTVGGVGSP